MDSLKTKPGNFFAVDKPKMVRTGHANMNINQILAAVRTKLQGTTTGGGSAARKAFKKFDKDGSGKIDKTEMGAFLRSCHIELTEKQVDELMNRIDEDGTGEIDYNEFVNKVMENSATSVQIGANKAEDADKALKQKVASSFKRLRDAFRHYDTDKDGFIDLGELRRACAHAGIQLSKEEGKRLMHMIDEDDNGKICNAEFMVR